MTDLHQANLDLYYASQRLRRASDELEAAQREHAAALARVEELERLTSPQPGERA